MSIENHPNLHAIKLGVEIYTSICKSLRGNATVRDVTPSLDDLIVEFVEKVEDKIDCNVAKRMKNKE
jgi:hypothetical protein